MKNIYSVEQKKSEVNQNSLPTKILQNIVSIQQKKVSKSYRFGLTWGWVNDYGILIFGVNCQFEG